MTEEDYTPDLVVPKPPYLGDFFYQNWNPKTNAPNNEWQDEVEENDTKALLSENIFTMDRRTIKTLLWKDGNWKNPTKHVFPALFYNYEGILLPYPIALVRANKYDVYTLFKKYFEQCRPQGVSPELYRIEAYAVDPKGNNVLHIAVTEENINETEITRLADRRCLKQHSNDDGMFPIDLYLKRMGKNTQKEMAEVLVPDKFFQHDSQFSRKENLSTALLALFYGMDDLALELAKNGSPVIYGNGTQKRTLRNLLSELYPEDELLVDTKCREFIQAQEEYMGNITQKFWVSSYCSRYRDTWLIGMGAANTSTMPQITTAQGSSAPAPILSDNIDTSSSPQISQTTQNDTSTQPAQTAFAKVQDSNNTNTSAKSDFAALTQQNDTNKMELETDDSSRDTPKSPNKITQNKEDAPKATPVLDTRQIIELLEIACQLALTSDLNGLDEDQKKLIVPAIERLYNTMLRTGLLSTLNQKDIIRSD